MLFKKAILPMLILASLAGCGPAVLDGTTPDALDASVAKVANKLPDEQRPQFGADLEFVKAYYVKQSPEQLLINLNGKNAAEITAEANNLRDQLKLEEEKLAVEEMKKAYLVELADKKASLLEAIKPLEDSKNQSLDRAKFQIQEVGIFLSEKQASGERINVIKLTVTNGSSQEIYRAFFKANLSVVGEDTSRTSGVLDVDFENGLQPGETRSLSFVPSLASEWRSVEVPANSALLLSTDELMNIANKPLFSMAQFSPDDQIALDGLNSELTAVNLELGVVDGSTEKSSETAAQPSPVIQPESPDEAPKPVSSLPEENNDSPTLPEEEPVIDPIELPSDMQSEPEAKEVVAAPAVVPAPVPALEPAPVPAPAAPAPEVVQEVAPEAPAEPEPVLVQEETSVVVEQHPLAPAPSVKIEDVSPASASTPKKVQAK
jgi:hypothetical protein